MITVHHLNNSRSQRILWLLEELNLPYEIKRYQRDPKSMLAPNELRQVHPLGKSPVITDDGKTIAESGAIVEYLVAKAGGKLKPAEGTPEALRYTYWLHYAEGSAMTPVLLNLIFSHIEKQPVPFFVKPIIATICQQVNKMLIAPQLKMHFTFIENELGKTEWFAGPEFTAADVQMRFPVEGAKAQGVYKGGGYPNSEAYLEKIHARPAYQRALEKGGPYDLRG